LELDILILKGLHVEADGRNSLDRLVTLVLQPVQYCCLACVIKAENEDSDLRGEEGGREEERKRRSELGSKQKIASTHRQGYVVRTLTFFGPEKGPEEARHEEAHAGRGGAR
jgi:hypothetical protein